MASLSETTIKGIDDQFRVSPGVKMQMEAMSKKGSMKVASAKDKKKKALKEMLVSNRNKQEFTTK